MLIKIIVIIKTVIIIIYLIKVKRKLKLKETKIRVSVHTVVDFSGYNLKKCVFLLVYPENSGIYIKFLENPVSFTLGFPGHESMEKLENSSRKAEVSWNSSLSIHVFKILAVIDAW